MILSHYRYLLTITLLTVHVDIWRYAVLYTFGGLYLDDDSDIRTSLDEVRLNKISKTYFI